jgi:S-adenosylmethionine decarboxylase
MQTNWKNLAPGLTRQRVIIEGITEKVVTDAQIHSYLIELAKVTGMEIMDGPTTWKAHELGYGGRVHWRSSGAVVYSYAISPPFFSVDCYTCKPFSAEKAFEFTKQYFKTVEAVWQEIKV